MIFYDFESNRAIQVLFPAPIQKPLWLLDFLLCKKAPQAKFTNKPLIPY